MNSIQSNRMLHQPWCSSTAPYSLWFIEESRFTKVKCLFFSIVFQIPPVPPAEERHLPRTSPLSFCWSCIFRSLHYTGWGLLTANGFGFDKYYIILSYYHAILRFSHNISWLISLFDVDLLYCLLQTN